MHNVTFHIKILLKFDLGHNTAHCLTLMYLHSMNIVYDKHVES